MPTITAPPITTPGWTEQRVEGLVIELLAELLDKAPDDLRRDLIEKGSAMPVDSLDLIDILVEFRQRTGLRIPKRSLGRQTMRSVQTFSRFVAREARP